MKKLLQNKNTITFITFIIMCFIFLFVYYNLLENNATKCENNGGIVVRNNFGYYEKCIYGVDKE